MYLLDAASSVVLVVCTDLRAIRRRRARRASRSSWQSLVEGIRFLRRQPIILSTMTLDMVAVLFGGATALLPIYATDMLHVGADGVRLAAGDAVAGRHRHGPACWPCGRRFAARGRALLWAVVVFGVATIVFGLSKSYPLSLAALFTLGAADNISVVIRATVLQLLTPDSMRGRVSAVSVIFIGTSNEIGELESGVVAQSYCHWPARRSIRAHRGRRRRDDAGDRSGRRGHVAGARAARPPRRTGPARARGRRRISAVPQKAGDAIAGFM